MTNPRTSSKGPILLGGGLLVVGVAVFAVRLLHAGPYAVPSGTNLLAGLGSLILGAILLTTSLPRWVGWLLWLASPVALFFGLYSTMAELEEVVSIYATDRAGNPVDLRLWIVDRDDGAWVGMSRGKAVEHSLNGARVQMLRHGQTQCVAPVLYEDRATVRAIHALKVEKYAVARGAAAIGLYPREAGENSVSLRLDPCPGG